MKKVSFVVLLSAILVMSAACSKSTEVSGELETDKQEEMDKSSGDSSDTESNKKENAPETDEDSSDIFDVENYLNASYSMDNTHYVTDKWENEATGRTDYTVNILPDTKEYSQEMNEKFQNAHSRVYEEIETLMAMAEKIMDELPTINDKVHIDSVNWMSYDGESSFMLIQDFENRDLQTVDKKDKETLSGYTAQQIEYARVWLLLGPNQELEELNVRVISAGSPINPNDDTSANYPEDVIQLAGARLVDGSVTYSGNGDGTINVYEVPLRWETSVPDDLDENYMKKLTESIIENIELVYVDPGDEEKIIKLIKLQKVHH